MTLPDTPGGPTANPSTVLPKPAFGHRRAAPGLSNEVDSTAKPVVQNFPESTAEELGKPAFFDVENYPVCAQNTPKRGYSAHIDSRAEALSTPIYPSETPKLSGIHPSLVLSFLLKTAEFDLSEAEKTPPEGGVENRIRWDSRKFRLRGGSKRGGLCHGPKFECREGRLQL